MAVWKAAICSLACGCCAWPLVVAVDVSPLVAVFVSSSELVVVFARFAAARFFLSSVDRKPSRSPVVDVLCLKARARSTCVVGERLVWCARAPLVSTYSLDSPSVVEAAAVVVVAVAVDVSSEPADSDVDESSFPGRVRAAALTPFISASASVERDDEAPDVDVFVFFVDLPLLVLDVVASLLCDSLSSLLDFAPPIGFRSPAVGFVMPPSFFDGAAVWRFSAVFVSSAAFFAAIDLLADDAGAPAVAPRASERRRVASSGSSRRTTTD